MKTSRKTDKIIQSIKTMDGAGVALNRVFGFHETGLFDPFLLLDFFGSDNPDDYMAGFPWHPHRGIETVTYMLEGSVEHSDSMGNKGVINSGDIQWMTAGSGIIHQEMPKTSEKGVRGFQLWANLPASKKMMNPRYQEIKATDIPDVKTGDVLIKVIAGNFNDVSGPVKEIITDPIYFDISVPANTEFEIAVKLDYTVFTFVFEGEGYFDEAKSKLVKKGQVCLLKDGNTVKVITNDSNTRFLLISGKPLKESIAWQGPIVMNTQQELMIAFREYQNGTFIK